MVIISILITLVFIVLSFVRYEKKELVCIDELREALRAEM